MSPAPSALVAVDGTPLQAGRTGGVARFVAGLVPALAELVEVVVLVDARAPLPSIGDVPVVPVRVAPGLPRLAWLELGAGSWLRHHDAVFVGTFCASPLHPAAPRVTVFHDVAWETHPEDFPALKRRVWSAYARASVRRSDAVLAVSAFTAGEVDRVYGVGIDAIGVVPNAIDEVFGPGASGPVPTGVRPPYVVTLGGAPRRHLDQAVAAWRRVRAAHADLQLVVVGDEAPPRERDVLAVGRIDDKALAAVLAGAEALVYATTFEGFGLPAAEAMACGTPVVCAPVAALPEVLGDAAAWASSPDGMALGDRLLALLRSPDEQSQLRANALRRAARTATWSDTAATVAEACASARRARG